MKFLLSLAFKNLTRYTKRTVITASAIAFGLGLFIFMDSWLKGMERDSEINLINYETGSAQIMDPGYLDERDTLPLKYTVENSAELAVLLKNQGYNTAPRIHFTAELFVREDPYPEDGSLFVTAVAIDPERDDSVFKMNETLTSGRYLKPDDNGVLIGEWLASDLGAEIGYPITLKTRTRNGAYETMDLEVTGILNVPNPLLNKGTVFLPLSLADYYLDMGGEVTEIAVNFSLSRNPDTEAAKIEEMLNSKGIDMKVHSWRDLARDYVAIASMKSGGSRVILFLVIVIAMVGISNTMLMAVFERVRELGMMRAMGMSSGQIRLAFLFEAGGIGLIGSIIGVLFGCLINWPFVVWGWDLTDLIQQMDIGYRISGAFRSMWRVQTIIQSFFAGIIIAMAVALVPIRRALKMQITECLRDE